MILCFSHIVEEDKLMFLIDRSRNSIIVQSVVFQFVEDKKLINRQCTTQDYFRYEGLFSRIDKQTILKRGVL